MTETETEILEGATLHIERMLRNETIPTRLRPSLRPVIEAQPVQEEPIPVQEEPIQEQEVKIDHTLIPINALEEVSRALMYGKEKHGAWGWMENPKSYTELLAKTQRHIFQFQRGETIDPKTGLSHLACAICDLMFLQSNVLSERGLDDRCKVDVATEA
jgi:hypothetical protein